MAYTLGEITLPKPKKFTRKQIELSVEHLVMDAKTTKKLQNRKEQFILEYRYLTQAQIGAIMSQYELNTSLVFTVDEANLTVAPTDVLMDMSERDYPMTGEQLREDLIIILTEVR